MLAIPYIHAQHAIVHAGTIQYRFSVTDNIYADSLSYERTIYNCMLSLYR